MDLNKCTKKELIDYLDEADKRILSGNKEIDKLYNEISGKDAEIKFLLKSVEDNNIAYRSQDMSYIKGLEAKVDVQKFDIDALQEVVENLTNKKDKEYIHQLEKLIIKNAIKEVK